MATRTETLKLRLTTAELELYKERAGAFGMTLSDWIRARCDSSSESELWAAQNQALDGLALTDNVIAMLQEKTAEKTTLAAAGLPDASPLLTGTPTPRVDPTAQAIKVYDSEKPRAKKMRTEMCVHRRRPAEYCSTCD